VTTVRDALWNVGVSREAKYSIVETKPLGLRTTLIVAYVGAIAHIARVQLPCRELERRERLRLTPLLTVLWAVVRRCLGIEWLLRRVYERRGRQIGKRADKIYPAWPVRRNHMNDALVSRLRGGDQKPIKSVRDL
jgi:hypothetical protein